MKLTSRTKGVQHKYTPKQNKKTMVQELLPTGKVKWVEEEDISPALKVSDYTLRVQLENGVFLNQEMPKINYGDPLSTAAIDNAMEEIKTHQEQVNAEQATKQKGE